VIDSSDHRGRGAQVERLAVALDYAWGQSSAPTVVASGRGELAERIVRTAEANGVPVRSDTDLAGALARIDVGEQIPPEAFAAVAEILAFLYRLDGTLIRSSSRAETRSSKA
jgi:flagellar biosynthesis protein